MNLTDPVADFLTRIRNAIRARHQKLDVPASKLKTEIARILKEEGYIANYKPAEENGMKVIRVYLKYGPNNEPSSATSSASRVPVAACTWQGRDSPRPGRPRHLDHDHPEGRHDRPSGSPRKRWRRDPLRSLVRHVAESFDSAS